MLRAVEPARYARRKYGAQRTLWKARNPYKLWQRRWNTSDGRWLINRKVPQTAPHKYP